MPDESIPPTESSEPSAVSQIKPAITFETLTFSDGTSIALDPHDIVAFVGPNNAGKSAALRDIEEHIGRPSARTVIRSVTLRRVGSSEQVRALVESRATRGGQQGTQFVYHGFRINVWDHQIEHAWNQDLGLIRGFFCLRLPTERRITDSDPAGGIAILEQPPSHPTHLVFADDSIEQRLSTPIRNYGDVFRDRGLRGEVRRGLSLERSM